MNSAPLNDFEYKLSVDNYSISKQISIHVKRIKKKNNL